MSEVSLAGLEPVWQAEQRHGYGCAALLFLPVLFVYAGHWAIGIGLFGIGVGILFGYWRSNQRGPYFRVEVFENRLTWVDRGTSHQISFSDVREVAFFRGYDASPDVVAIRLSAGTEERIEVFSREVYECLQERKALVDAQVAFRVVGP